MFGPRSSGRARLLRAGLLSAAALVAAGPASAATVTKAWSGTCSVGPAGQTKLSLPANFAFTATLPDTVRPGGSFGATNPSYTITFPGTAVKSLAAAGSGVTADVRSLWLVSNSNPSQITPDGYNMAQGGVRSARQAFQTDRLDLFDGTKTTYKGLSLAVTPPSSTTALLASGTFKTEMAIATDVFGDLLIDQLFGQVKWELYCRQLGTGSSIFLQSVRIANSTPVLSSLSPKHGPARGRQPGDDHRHRSRRGDRAIRQRHRRRGLGVVDAAHGARARRNGTVEVRATSPAGLLSAPLSYTYAISSGPRITSVSPGTAWENLSARITLTLDTSFGVSAVRFGGAAVNFTQSRNQITFDAPGLPKGTYPIAVTFQNGQTATASFRSCPGSPDPPLGGVARDAQRPRWAPPTTSMIASAGAPSGSIHGRRFVSNTLGSRGRIRPRAGRARRRS